MRVKISDILKATGGKLLCGDEAVAVTSFFTDSRQAKAGAMFVPIRGERADGHDYIPAVLESPAAATFTDHEIPLGEKPIVLVKDCREALQKAAAWYREQFAIPVVGVTYEFNRFVGRHDNAVTRVLSAPGMWLQNFTTNEPDDSMLEVAIEALKLVLPEEQGKDAW